ncbi:MAG: ABC transporter substrate-binding protein [Acidobacteriota bacterium]|nr:ABC transporter substrate-binding protein [Acidobacteriota bacterium]
MRRRPLVTFLVVLCVACGGGEKPAAPKPAASVPLPADDTPRDGGTLNRRLDIDINSLNPVIPGNRGDRYVTQYLFTPLLNIDRDLQPSPGLAKTWEVSADGLRYRFHLDERATFSDGTPVRASDVVYTIGKIVDPQTKASQLAGNFEQIDMANTRAIDEHTAEIAFKQPLASQLIKFIDLQVLPEHVYAKGKFLEDYNDRVVGSGPYTLVRRVPGKEVVIARRKDYWGTRPHIETIVFKVIEDHGTAFSALRRGEIDETLIASDTWARESKNPQLASTVDFQRFYTLNYNYIAWNNRDPLLADKRVRRALSMCVPIDQVINDLYHGTGRAMSGPFTPDEWAYNPNVPVVRHDVAAAKQLLAAAGWADHNGDGVVDKDGKPLRLELVVMTGSATAAQLAQLAQAELKKAGVQLEIALMDGTMAIQRILGGNFQSAYLSWDLDPDPDPYNLFHSSQMPPAGQNFVHYSNPEADRLIDTARRELDQAKRKQLYWRLHEVLAEDQPYTWVVQSSAKWGLNRRLHGVVASHGFGYFLWSPGELDWWLAPAR